MSDEKTVTVYRGGGCGCLSLVLFILFMWALCFGVTWNGVHHDLSCSCDKGVQLK